MHIQDLGLSDWQQASDEEHIQGLFQRPEFINPRWMAYLERERPNIMTKFLQMWQAQGGYMSPIAHRRLRK